MKMRREEMMMMMMVDGDRERERERERRRLGPHQHYISECLQVRGFLSNIFLEPELVTSKATVVCSGMAFQNSQNRREVFPQYYRQCW
jgi:hypothetical protein